ncbi:MAG: HEPN domain-containing protein [Deltaproteobacteria bacterium]|nr:HEPN domain-containing protein [Deltaproteobacteria bacterium]
MADGLKDKWLERSRYDLETAEAMLKARRYLYVSYMCQQSVEKLFKALIVEKGESPVPIHNLNRLAEIAGLTGNLSESEKMFLDELTAYCIEARYGDYKEELSEICDRKKAMELLRKTREIWNRHFKKKS